ncbi:hypothetical protein HNY73_022124 [Argiope bruennichi]|uniref:Uncharacterized protein n=1 Tax=Argiope bruennichi TaxID=94029 RepID=A0A8T0E274_ARGBR|nr:hypothetical protein HNY73_022124 [Argiope bruennichi]
MDQKDLKTNSKVSFATTDDSETRKETDEDIENESLEDKQSELPSQDEDEKDVPTLIPRIPSWRNGNEDLEHFDNLLHEISSCTDSNTKDDEDITDEKKWLVELGNNRNYIRALINFDVNNNWYRAIKSKEDFEKSQHHRKFKWIINYDNLNYIRSLLSPEIFERILKEDLSDRSEVRSSDRYRELLVN